MLGFKGLEREREAVVLALNGFKQTERAKEMLYVGCPGHGRSWWCAEIWRRSPSSVVKAYDAAWPPPSSGNPD